MTRITPGRMDTGQYLVSATAFFSLFSLVGIMFYGLPFFYDFWVKDFGWSRATVTSGNAFGKVIVGLFGFIAGWLIDRHGPRRIMLFGILCGGISLMALSRMSSLGQFYFFYILSALGYMCGGPLPNQVLVSHWFAEARGRMMGIAYLGIGIGGMLVPQMAKWLNLHVGWHRSLFTLGVLIIVFSFPLAWFVRDTPKKYVGHAAAENNRLPLNVILRNRPFYLLLLGSMCAIAAVSGTIQNLKLFFTLDMKYAQAHSANIISLILLSSIFGRLLVGWMADRYPKKWVMMMLSTIVACAILLLYFVSAPGVIYIFAFIFGVGLGGDYMIIPLIAADLFGLKVLGRVMGIILAADSLADALAPTLVGWLADRLGNYTHAFTVLVAFAVIAITAIGLLPRKTQLT
ncbi:MAG TPA: MFS transporter [Puia sp.]|nr:MFS transporter [Puia sp.]